MDRFPLAAAQRAGGRARHAGLDQVLRRRRARDLLCRRSRHRALSLGSRQLSRKSDRRARRCCGLPCVRPNADPPYDLGRRHGRSSRGRGLGRPRQRSCRHRCDAGRGRESWRPLSPSTMSSRRSVKRKRDRADPEALARRADVDDESDSHERARKFFGAMVEAQARRKRCRKRTPQSDGSAARRNKEASRRRAGADDAATPGERSLSTSPACRRSNSIGADTDITAFLRPGVPPELTVRRFVAPGRPIPPSATLSGWSRTGGTSTIRTRWRVSADRACRRGAACGPSLGDLPTAAGEAPKRAELQQSAAVATGTRAAASACGRRKPPKQLPRIYRPRQRPSMLRRKKNSIAVISDQPSASRPQNIAVI